MKTYTLTLTESQLGVIHSALVNGPYQTVAPIIAHINSEIQRLYNEQYDKQREPESAAHHPV